jgi:hypothetical protein
MNPARSPGGSVGVVIGEEPPPLTVPEAMGGNPDDIYLLRLPSYPAPGPAPSFKKLTPERWAEHPPACWCCDSSEWETIMGHNTIRKAKCQRCGATYQAPKV